MWRAHSRLRIALGDGYSAWFATGFVSTRKGLSAQELPVYCLGVTGLPGETGAAAIRRGTTCTPVSRFQGSALGNRGECLGRGEYLEGALGSGPCSPHGDSFVPIAGQ